MGYNNKYMSTIQSIARFKIHPGKLEEFKRLSAKCVVLAREKDTGTLRYELFFSEDQTECVVYEEYVDSEASIQHFRNMGETSTAIFKTSDVSGEMWGNPSPELRKGIQDKNVKLFTPFLSL
jgi:quinol monooxygenase YgiN